MHKELSEIFSCKRRLCVANLVDVTGEVEHLVGEAPLVLRKLRFLRGKHAQKVTSYTVFSLLF